MISRRHLFGLAGAALALPRAALAAGGSSRKVVFVFAQGGWDPTRVLADGFDIEGVDMEAGAERATAGGISYVDHPDRPSVRAFFEANHSRSVVFNGVMVRSIAHEICTMIAMTGTSSGVSPDWPSIIAASDADPYVLPQLVLGGPSFPGDLGVYTARTGANGQLGQLLDGSIFATSDQAVRSFRAPTRSLVDSYVSRRAAVRRDFAASAGERALTGDFAAAAEHMQELQDLRYAIDFSATGDAEGQIGVLVDALSLGVCRCATVATGVAGTWDSHAQNDDTQSPLWEGTFATLIRLQAALDAAGLAEDTTVVVLSEMGRTPALNGFNGKDHWPFTSVLAFGAGLVGDRTVGEWDENWYGKPVDPASGDVTEDGQTLSAEAVGATILALCDIDPAEHVSGVEPIAGVLA